MSAPASTAANTTAGEVLVPLRDWARQTGTPLRTAYRWAAEGVLSGDDAQHPTAIRLQGHWYVAPRVHAPAQVVPAMPIREQSVRPEELERRVRLVVLDVLREIAERLETAVAAAGDRDAFDAPTPATPATSVMPVTSRYDRRKRQ